MKKNFLQDVIPANQKRSIRDIPLPSHKGRKTSSSKKEAQYTEEPIKKTPEPAPASTSLQGNSYSTLKYEDPVFEPNQFHANSNIQSDIEEEAPPRTAPNFTNPTYKKPKKSTMKKILIGFLCGIIIFFIFILSRTNAEITIQPKKVTKEINNVILLDQTNKLATKTQITQTLTQTLVATSEQQVEKQASGRIKIINKHKEVPQELVKNTRFQAPNGLIYRIKNSIVIPGYTMSGSTLVPGTLEVEVFADSAGEEYNISDTRFTIPGFSGKEQFEKITAETVGSLSGGYIGVRKVVSEDAKEKAQEELEAGLKTKIEQTQTQSTEYVLVPNPETLVYGELQDKAEGDSVVLTLSATVDAYSFVKKDLATFIGQNTVEGSTSTDAFSVELDKLAFVFDKDTIKINGSSVITWLTDTEKLKKDFVNKKRSEIPQIIDTYRSFETSDSKLSPFWKTRFPSDPSKIEVIIIE